VIRVLFLILNYRLIASDAMSRGLDIEEVEAVVNYDVPPFIKTYIHRYAIHFLYAVY